jgi:hypothetical protein
MRPHGHFLRTRSLWVMTVFILLTLILGRQSCSMPWSCCRLLARRQHLGAVSLQRADRPLRDVVLHRLLGHA